MWCLPESEYYILYFTIYIVSIDTDTFLQIALQKVLSDYPMEESLMSPIVEVAEVSCLTFMYRGIADGANFTVKTSHTDELFFHTNMQSMLHWVPGMVSCVYVLSPLQKL